MRPATAEQSDSLSGFPSFSSWTLGLAAAFVVYAVLCSSLRFRRLKQVRARFHFPDRASLSQMTNEDARKIVEHINLYEFPLLYDLSLHYALFKTYTVDNIGNLLYQVSGLAKPDEASKRYGDTSVLFASYATFPLGSDALAKSIARTNYLHNPYIKAGKIRNEDLLYVLFESMYQPVRFMRLYEWRELADVEVAAIATLWKYIGEMMEIDYQAALGKNQWRDGVEFLEDVAHWAEGYENEHMGPSPGIGKLGTLLMDLLLAAYPKFARPLGRKMLLVLMGERMRHAFSFPEPGVPESALTFSLLLIRKLCIRHLCLPRIIPFKYLDPPDPKTGRITQYNYKTDPWYIPATFWNRWGPEALLQRAFGLKVPGDGGAEMRPEGFLFQELGPRNKVNVGAEETSRLASIAHTKASGFACPFALPRKS